MELDIIAAIAHSVPSISHIYKKLLIKSQSACAQFSHFSQTYDYDEAGREISI